MKPAYVDGSADVSSDAEIGAGTSVWHFVQVREGVRLGERCVIGRGVYIGPGVEIGDFTKIQNLAQIYDPAVIGRGVFIGPAVVLTNDVYPRAVDPDLQPKSAGGWDAVGVKVGDGASIGARSVVLAGVEIGDWALVGAGSTVIRDVPPYALVVGNPAVRKGWVGRTGRRLVADGGGRHRCADTGECFHESDGTLISLADPEA